MLLVLDFWLVMALLVAFLMAFPSLAVSKDLDQAIVHYNHGYDYYKKGEYDKAVEELSQIR